MSKNEHISIKLFLGCPLSADLRMKLHDSDSWKKAHVQENALLEVKHGDKEYVGRIVTQARPSLPELKDAQRRLIEELTCHCPGLTADNMKAVIFPQVFLS